MDTKNASIFVYLHTDLFIVLFRFFFVSVQDRNSKEKEKKTGVDGEINKDSSDKYYNKI